MLHLDCQNPLCFSQTDVVGASHAITSTLGWVAGCGAGVSHSRKELCGGDIPPNSQLPHEVLGPARFSFLPLLQVILWLLLYIFSYKTSVQVALDGSPG